MYQWVAREASKFPRVSGGLQGSFRGVSKEVSMHARGFRERFREIKSVLGVAQVRFREASTRVRPLLGV